MLDFINWREVRDQTLHFITGGLIVVLLNPAFAWPYVLAFSLAIGVGRELLQHGFTCKAGCRRDLFFWSVGAFVASIWKAL